MLSIQTSSYNRSSVEKLTCRPKLADIINLDEDESTPPIHYTNVSRHRRKSDSASLGKRSLTTFERNDDLEVIGENLVERTHSSRSKIRRIDHESSSPAPACGQNVFNRLIKPEVRLMQTKAQARLDLDALRVQFLQNLRTLLGPPVTLFNDIDDTSPPSHFTFISKNVLSRGVKPASSEWMAGCTCRKDNGRHMGCEHLSCECVQQSEVNEQGRRYFPYSAAESDYGCLRSVYIKMRNHIYECNDMCNCDNNCKNRLVQHGRTIPLEIFKTKSRGWGLRCPNKLLKGQFIDTYRGEVITNEESNRRGLARARDQNEDNYLFGLDKFCEPQTITRTIFKKRHPDKKAWHRNLVASGEYEVTVDEAGNKLYLNPDYTPPVYSIDSKDKGGPTRFINHSCDPNCAIYTVSYNHSDYHLYDVAFFATEDIAAGVELTFDYADSDETQVITDEMADELEQKNGERPIKCLCGSEKCRGYFFHS